MGIFDNLDTDKQLKLYKKRLKVRKQQSELKKKLRVISDKRTHPFVGRNNELENQNDRFLKLNN